MLDFAALDVALGVIFVYLVLALVCSALNESISSVLSWRAKFLREGIANLLDPNNHSNGRKLLTQLYDHPLINGLIRPVSRKGKLRYPSYLPSRAFASALLDFDGKGAGRSIDQAIAAIPSPQIRTALTTLRSSAKVKEGEDEAAAFKQAVEAWYDDAMERVSGWYRRRVQVVMWVLAAGIAFSLNVDTIRIADHLWKDKTVRSAVVARTENPPDTTQPADISRFSKQVNELKELKLPIGWSIESRPKGFWDWLRRVLLKGTGLILTAAALTLGAPFWFDMLGKVARIRSAGARPAADETKPVKETK